MAKSDQVSDFSYGHYLKNNSKTCKKAKKRKTTVKDRIGQKHLNKKEMFIIT